MRELLLPYTFEQIRDRIGIETGRMMEFVVPVEEFEQQIMRIVNDIHTAKHGRILFVHGISGSGKSTFIQSLKWRKHIPIREISNIDASELAFSDGEGNKLSKLLGAIRRYAVLQHSIQSEDSSICVVIDYLESLEDEDEREIRGFFRDINGLLRKWPILVIWPLVSEDDLQHMIDNGVDLSSTIFDPQLPVMRFTGPPLEKYADIVRNTVRVMNKGQTIYDFQLHDDDLTEIKHQLLMEPKPSRTIRKYLELVRGGWENRVSYVGKFLERMPKPTEVWLVFPFPEAESVIGQFARRSADIPEDSWNADYNTLAQYTQDNSRSADWSTQRLLLALSGVLTTKMLFMPTNALVSCLIAYSEQYGIGITRDEFVTLGIPNHWFGEYRAGLFLQSAPLYRQICGEDISLGKRRSGTVEQALETARPAYEHIVQGITNRRWSDSSLNKAMAAALKYKTALDGLTVDIFPERTHPWIPHIRPDILIPDLRGKIICIEFHYTTRTAPNIVADYTLSKLNAYMKQIEALQRDPQLPLL